MPEAAGRTPTDEEKADLETRLRSSVRTAFEKGSGALCVKAGNEGLRRFVNRFEADGKTFQEPDEYMFSFNSPLGACPVCGGLGQIIGISEDRARPDKSTSSYDGALACWRGEKLSGVRNQMGKNAYR